VLLPLPSLEPPDPKEDPMKTLCAFAFLFLAAACANVDAGGTSSVQSECVYSLSGNASAAELQQAVNDVLERRIDPCAGAVSDLSSRAIELVRIDHGRDADDQPTFRLVFHFSNPDFKPTNEP
jgi:hypothetical protein